jgi:hypothetical protein
MTTIHDVTVDIRDSNLTRISRIPDYDLVGFHLVRRFNNVGYWEINISNASPIVGDLTTPGNGIIVQLYDQIIFSGPVTSVTRVQSQDDPNGIWRVQGVDDNQILQDYLAWPAAPLDDVENQDQSWYSRSGTISTLIYNLIDENIGGLAGAARAYANLELDADPVTGGEGYISTKWDTLGHAATRLAYMSSPQLRFSIIQDFGSTLHFQIEEIQDHTNEYRFDIFNNQILRNEWTYTAPDATIAIVGGLSDGIDRIYREATTDGSVQAELDWSRRIEVFVDNKSDYDSAVLIAQGQSALRENGVTKHGFSIVPNEDVPFYRFGSDFDLGDTVTVTIESNDVLQTITEYALSIAADGIRQTLGIGNVEVLQNISGDAPQMTIVGRYAAKTQKLQNRLKSLEAAVSNTSSLSVQTVGPGVSAALGDAGYFWGRNISGLDIFAMTPVAIVGSDQGFPTIEPLLSITDGGSSIVSIAGLVVSDIADDSGGLIAIRGRTARIDTSAYVDGQVLYLAADGTITDVVPEHGDIVIELGRVLTADADGSFYFDPVWKPYIASPGYFEARITAGSQSIASDASNYTRVGNSATANQQWTIENIDNDIFSLSTSAGTRGILTVNKAGRYSLYGHVRWGTNTSGKRNLRFNLNSGDFDLAAVAAQAVDTTRLSISRPSVYLNAGDTIALEVLQTSGSSVTIVPTTTGAHVFYVEYLGG